MTFWVDPTIGSCRVLSVAPDLQVDGVGIVGKKDPSNQTEHLRKKQNIFIIIKTFNHIKTSHLTEEEYFIKNK